MYMCMYICDVHTYVCVIEHAVADSESYLFLLWILYFYFIGQRQKPRMRRYGKRKRDTCSTISMLVNIPPAGGDQGFVQRPLCTVRCVLSQVHHHLIHRSLSLHIFLSNEEVFILVLNSLVQITCMYANIYDCVYVYTNVYTLISRRHMSTHSATGVTKHVYSIRNTCSW